MPKIDNLLISYCGVICQYCPAYRRGLCLGCDAHVGECKFARCVRERGVGNCLLCSEFPCKLHTEGFEWLTEEYGKLRWKIYSNIFLQIMKKIQVKITSSKDK